MTVMASSPARSNDKAGALTMNIEEVLQSHGMGGKKGLVRRTGTVKLTAAGSTATIPVTYVPTSEVLILVANGQPIQSPTEYTETATAVTKVGTPWDKGTVLDFIVIGGSATPSGTFDGSLLSNGTVTNAKMHTDAKVGSLAALTTTDKSSATAAINEVKASVAAVQTSVTVQQADAMPNRFVDNGKTYKYGFKLNADQDGLVFVYEEVV